MEFIIILLCFAILLLLLEVERTYTDLIKKNKVLNKKLNSLNNRVKCLETESFYLFDYLEGIYEDLELRCLNNETGEESK